MLAWGLTSCQIYGVTNGIGQLPKEYRERLVETDAPIDSLIADGNIYIVSVDRIKEFLANNDTVLMYSWVPGCSSSQCVLPSFIERYCDVHNYKCLIWYSYLCGSESFTMYDAQHVPCLLPDFSIYGSKYHWKYFKRFCNDMIGLDWSETNWLFAGGKYVKSLRVEDM